MPTNVDDQSQSQIERVLRGDLAAYQPLVAEHQQAVWRTLSVLLYDPAKTQTLMQIVFADAYASLSKAEAAGGFGPLVLAIARRRVRRELKHALAHTDQLKLIREHLASRFEDDAAAAKWMDLSHAALLQCCKALPDTASSIVEARWHKGMAPAAIAKATGKHESVIRQKLNRVRLALYPCIKQALAGAVG